MMNLFKGVAKVALSPVAGVAEVFSDLSGGNSESEQGLSIMTCGLSSLAKGTAKGICSGASDIFNS